MKKHVITFAGSALLAASQALGAADFSLWEAHSVPAEELATLAGAATTSAIDGVALGADGKLFAVHTDAAADETIILFDPETDPPAGTILRTSAQIAADLGFTGTPIFESGFSATADGRYLYFVASDSLDIDGDLVLARIDSETAPFTATEILSGPDLDDLTDFAVHPSGQIVGVRGPAGVGVIDPGATTPTWTQKVTEAQLQAILSTTTEAPAEAIAIQPVSGLVYIFAHDVLEMFSIADILTTPNVQRVEIPGWPGVVDFHDLSVDEFGVLIGFDEASESIRLWDGFTTHNFPLDDLAEGIEPHDHTKHGPGSAALEPALWRGLAQRAGEDQGTVLFIGTVSDELGVVEIHFAPPAPLSAEDWNLYE